MIINGQAGVQVSQLCFGGVIHDFVMRNALDQTAACRAAIDVSIGWINRKNWQTQRCQQNRHLALMECDETGDAFFQKDGICESTVVE